MVCYYQSYGVPLASGGANLAGKYDGAARAWDQIAYNAPFYLNVYSAGNDGNNNNSNPTTPGFDKLIGEKNSKNN